MMLNPFKEIDMIIGDPPMPANRTAPVAVVWRGITYCYWPIIREYSTRLRNVCELWNHAAAKSIIRVNLAFNS